ncbi:MAG: inositol monophosphatase [Alphaproteobacteria bacterium]|nr:inositol monophosphatase [Alphaproteobacteria bacterium]
MRTPIINVMDRAARRAGRVLARDFGEVQQLQASRKGAGDFVTAGVRKASQTLRYELEKARPKFTFYGEPATSDEQLAEKHCWIVSPLVGTVNYVHGQPHFAISIAHEEDGNLIESVVYDPLSEELFWAVRNTGAYLNDTRLRVSARQNINEGVIATGMPAVAQGDHPRYLATLTAVMADAGGIRQFGAPALDLAYLAAGRFDGYWHFELPPEEIAAGILMVREAGGFISDFAGRDTMMTDGDVVAGNSQLHDILLRCLRTADPGPSAAEN